MSRIKALEIPTIKALGLNNKEGNENPLQKSLSIKYISCEEKGISLNLKFEVEAKNFKNFKAYINISRGDISTNALSSESVTKLLEINPNGKRNIEIEVPLSFGDNENYKTKKYYRASVAVDGIWAISEGFKIILKKQANLNSEGYYYAKDGGFIKKTGNSDDVYLDNGEKLAIDNINLLRIAGLAYAESGYSEDIIKAIPFCIINRHKIYLNANKNKENYGIYDTLYKMRNKWDDYTYANEHHYGAYGNPAFRDFLGINLNDAIDFDKNVIGRNENKLMKLSIEYSIKSLTYQKNSNFSEDPSKGGVGWQGVDIVTGTNNAAIYWRNNLFVHSEHKKYGFANWVNKKSLDTSISETTMIGKGTFGTTIIWKQTEFTWKQDPIKARL